MKRTIGNFICFVTTSGALALALSAVAQTNVQNVQVVGTPSGPPQPNLPNLSAVSTPVDTPPPQTSGAGLSSLITLPPQNSGASAATSPSPATSISPAASANPGLSLMGPQVRFSQNQQVGEGIVNTNPAKAGGSPAASATPAPTNIQIQGSQVNQATQDAGTETATITPTKNVPIQGSQINDASHATGTGTGTITPSKNIIIQNSQFNDNNPTATAAPGNTINAGDAGNAKINQHPKTKRKGHGQPSDPATAGGDHGRKLHHAREGQMSEADEQGDAGRGRHQHRHDRQMESRQREQGDAGAERKAKPTPTPQLPVNR